jgi:hypothetical protein
MMGRAPGGWLGRRSFEVPCTVEVEHTPDSLHAYVDLDGDIEIGPGDEVIVHGEPIHASFGEKIVERRRATVIRANWLGRLATRVHSGFELTELYEVSFTPRRKL